MSEAKRKIPPAFSTRAEPVEIDLADEAPLPVFLLRPRVGVEQIDARQRRVRQPVEQLRRVVVVDAQIGERRFGDRGHHLRHAVDEGLDADEADAGMGRRLVHQMLAAAEADLQADVRHLGRETAS